ncbi:hypothetical protein ACFFRL_04610 [Agromyces hippuratus]
MGGMVLAAEAGVTWSATSPGGRTHRLSRGGPRAARARGRR